MTFKLRDVKGMSYEELQDYVFELEAVVSATEEQRALEREFNLRRYFNLTETEGRILALMSDGRVRDKNSLLTLAYGGSDDTPGIKIMDVYISRLRRKLRGSGITISTVWGSGYVVENAEKLRDVMAGKQIEVNFDEEDPSPPVGRPTGARNSTKKGAARDKALEWLRERAVDGVVEFRAKDLAAAVNPKRSGYSILETLIVGGYIEVLDRPPVGPKGGTWRVQLVDR